MQKRTLSGLCSKKLLTGVCFKMSSVSIITTFYNSENTIQESIASIKSQTHQDFEYILIDDGSDDRSPEYVNQLLDQRMTLIQPGRIGRAAALNLGLEKSKSDYIAILDADDIALPDRLSHQIRIFDSNHDISLLSSDALLIDLAGKVIGKKTYPTDHKSLQGCLYNLSPFPHSSVMFQRKKIVNFGGYLERCEKSIDFNMYLELIDSGGMIASIPEPLIKLRVYSSSWGQDDIKSLQIYYGILGLINHHIFQRHGVGFLRGDDTEWQLVKNVYDQWFGSSSFLHQSNAKKSYAKFLESFKQKEIKESLQAFNDAFRTDPLFWSHRGIHFSYPEDILAFMSLLRVKLLGTKTSKNLNLNSYEFKAD